MPSFKGMHDFLGFQDLSLIKSLQLDTLGVPQRWEFVMMSSSYF